MLFLVATPIGNLSDISKRALETLSNCDLILCEDTRHSGMMLKQFEIEKPLMAFHQFNEKTRQDLIVDRLKQGCKIALISDAGTPLISDPGQMLVRSCVQEQIPITAIPGPCSIIQALLLSGFDSTRFQFIGFLPKEQNPLRESLRRALFYRGTTIAFESPRRLVETLEALEALDPARSVAVARELTKTYEECRRGIPSQLLSHFRAVEPRGEIVLAIAEGAMPQEGMGVQELVELLQELHGLSLKDAIKTAAQLKNLPKRSVYKEMHGS